MERLAALRAGGEKIFTQAWMVEGKKGKISRKGFASSEHRSQKDKHLGGMQMIEWSKISGGKTLP